MEARVAREEARPTALASRVHIISYHSLSIAQYVVHTYLSAARGGGF